MNDLNVPTDGRRTPTPVLRIGLMALGMMAALQLAAGLSGSPV